VQEKINKIVMAAVLIALGFSMGWIFAPQAGQTFDGFKCVHVKSTGAIWLKCTGTYRVFTNPVKGLKITDVSTVQSYQAGMPTKYV